MDFKETLAFLFSQISTAYKVNLEKQMNSINLHGGQVFILFELWNNDGQSQIELAKNLNVSPPTINKMVKNLAENDFVFCKRCKADTRIMRVYLSQKGLDIRPQLWDQWQKVEEQLIANLTETEKLILFQLFGKIKDNLLTK